MAIALVTGQHAQATSVTSAATIAVSFPVGTTAGNLITIAPSSDQTGTHATPTDDKSNTYAASAPSTDGGTTERVSGWYAKNCIAAAVSVTAHFTTAAANLGIEIAEFSGADTSAPLDKTGGLATSAATDAFSPSVTPTTNNQLIWGASKNDQDIPVAGTGYTLLDADGLVGIGHEYLIQGTAAAVTTEFSETFSGQWVVLIATYKAAAAGAAAKAVPLVAVLQAINRGATR